MATKKASRKRSVSRNWDALMEKLGDGWHVAVDGGNRGYKVLSDSETYVLYEERSYAVVPLIEIDGSGWVKSRASKDALASIDQVETLIEAWRENL